MSTADSQGRNRQSGDTAGHECITQSALGRARVVPKGGGKGGEVDGVHGPIPNTVMGHVDIWIRGYMETWIRGYMDTWIHGYVDTWIHVSNFRNILKDSYKITGNLLVFLENPSAILE